jgi:hypothetical protein
MGDALDLVAVALAVLVVVEIFLQILSGAKRIARAGDHQDLGVVVVFQVAQRIVHLAMQCRAHGVLLFRPIEPDGSDAVVLLDQDRFILAHLVLR